MKWFFALALMTLVPGLGPASAWSKTSFMSESLTIPFAPPLDTDLEYSVTIEKLGTKPSKTVMRQKLRFSRAPNGYLLDVRILNVASNGQSIDLSTPAAVRRVPAELRPFMVPLTFDLSPEGTIVRVHDWPALQTAIANLSDLVVEKEPIAERAKLRQAIAQVMQVYVNMDAAQAVAALLKGWPEMLGYGGVTAEANQEYEIAGEMQSPLAPVMVPVTGRYVLTRGTGEGAFRLEQRSAPDANKSSAIIVDYFNRIAASVGGAEGANFAKGADVVRGMKIDDTLSVSFDGTTGIIREGMTQRSVSLADGTSGGERITIILAP